MMLWLLGLSRRPPSGATNTMPPPARDTAEERRATARKIVDARRRLAALEIESDIDRG